MKLLVIAIGGIERTVEKPESNETDPPEENVIVEPVNVRLKRVARLLTLRALMVTGEVSVKFVVALSGENPATSVVPELPGKPLLGFQLAFVFQVLVAGPT